MAAQGRQEMNLENGEGSGAGSPSPDLSAAGSAPTPSGNGALKRALLALVTGTTHVVALVEGYGHIAYVSPSVTAHLGYRSDEMVGHHFAEFLHPEDLVGAAAMMAAEVSRPGRAGTFGPDADIAGEYRLKHIEGRWVAFEVVRNNFLAEPDIGGVLILCRPVGSRQALDRALSVLAYDPDGGNALSSLSEYLDGRLPGTCSAVLVASDPPEWIGGSDIATLMGGRGPWDRAMSLHQPVYSVVGEAEAFEPAVDAAAHDAGYQACWCLPLPIREPQVYTMGVDSEHLRAAVRAVGWQDEVSGCLVVWSRRELEPPFAHLGVLERVSGLADLAIKRRRERQHLRNMVDFDHVTGALSRAGLASMIAGSESSPRARVLIDLDDFKDVNDRHGHTIGDDVLRVAVKRLTSVLRYQDLLCRLGGDEFLLLVAGGEIDHAVTVARRIAAALEDPIIVGSVTVQVRASIGIASWEPDVPPAQLVERADQAMYEAKRRGKNRWAVWGEH
jgi:diguanylate cyclase (GGDEF)-like protein/PAS domain S-box-containing protein